jgi:hypothetical protein
MAVCQTSMRTGIRLRTVNQVWEGLDIYGKVHIFAGHSLKIRIEVVILKIDHLIQKQWEMNMN